MSPSLRARRLETIKFLTQDETRRLFTVIRDKRDRALFLLAYRHGLRASEVGLLHVADLDLKKLRVMIHRLKGSLPGLPPILARQRHPRHPPTRRTGFLFRIQLGQHDRQIAVLFEHVQKLLMAPSAKKNPPSQGLIFLSAQAPDAAGHRVRIGVAVPRKERQRGELELDDRKPHNPVLWKKKGPSQ